MSRNVSRLFILTAALFFLVACLEGLMFPMKSKLAGIYAVLFHLDHDHIGEFFNHFVSKIHTHVALVGWLTSAVMGILYYLAPLISGKDRVQPWAAYGNYFCQTLGVALLAVGFHLIGHFGAGLEYESPAFRAAVQPVRIFVMLGGSLIFVSGVLFAYNMFRTLLGEGVKSNASHREHRSAPSCTPVIATLILLILCPAWSAMAETSQAPDRIDAIIVGDRLVDVAYNLGVLPKGMAVRTTLWPLTETLKGGTDILGCPSRVVKKPETIPEAAARLGVQRIIIEKNAQFCTYMPSVNPEKVVPLLEGKGLTVEFVDFNHGLESAVRQTATMLGREDKADALLNEYATALATAKNKANTVKPGRKLLILSGIQQKGTGKVTVQIEAPGGYTDRFMLTEMGGINVGDAFAVNNATASKGYFTAPKRKHGVDLAPMLTKAPDIIAIFGNVYAVQKALAVAVLANPALAEVPAIKNHRVYALPQYVDSGVLEYPEILAQWADAMTE